MPILNGYQVIRFLRLNKKKHLQKNVFVIPFLRLNKKNI